MQVGERNGSGYVITERREYIIDGKAEVVFVSRNEDHPQVGYYTRNSTFKQYSVIPGSWTRLK